MPEKKESDPKGSFFFLIFVFLTAVLLDQLTKFMFFRASSGFANAAFAFSLPLPSWLMYTTYFIVLAAIIAYCLRRWPRLDLAARLAWTLVFAGAISNIAERLALGYVRDFIFLFSGVFNLADFFILLGIILLLWSPRRAGHDL